MALFTTENAREMALRANLVRWHSPKPPEPLPQPAAIPQPFPTAIPDAFTIERLERVRSMIARLDRMLANAKHSKKIRELSDALRSLAEQERILAGRPLPGSRRPPREKSSTPPPPVIMPLDE